MDSILTSIKLALGITADAIEFDGPLIMHINSALTTLKQLGVGPKNGFMIKSAMETWDKFLGYSSIANAASTVSTAEEDPVYVELVKTYMYLKVKMVFDPPTNSSLLEAMKNEITEMEWRLTVETNN